MTTSHPVPIRHRLAPPLAFVPETAVESLFFDPRSNRVARNTEDARETTQRGALLVSSQNLLFGRFVIAVGARLLAQTTLAGAALVTLFAVARQTVLVNLVAATVVTIHTAQFATYSLH